MDINFEYPVDFQVDILGFLLRDPENLRRFNESINPKYFSEYQLQDVIQVAKVFFEKYGEAPSKSTLSTLIQGHIKHSKKTMDDYVEYINKMYTTTINVDFVRDEVVKFVKIQALRNAIYKSQDFLEDGEKVLGLVESALASINKLTFDAGYDYKEQVEERMAQHDSDIRDPNQILTLFKGIDKCLDGGLASGELGVIVAPPNSYKTTTLFNMAINAAGQGHNVVYVTLEMAEKKIASRADSTLMKMNKHEIRDSLDSLMRRVSCMPGNIMIKEMPTGATKSTDIKNYVAGLEYTCGFKADLILVDYLGLMESIKHFQLTRDKLANICMDLTRDVAKNFGVPLWTAHQANIFNSTEKELELITIKHISEGKVAISANCDFAFSLNQMSAEKQSTPEQLRFYVLRNRYGIKEEVYYMNVDKFRASIKNCPVNSIIPIGDE